MKFLMSVEKYTKPPALTKGDTIGIIAPSSPFFSKNLNSGVQHLRQFGFKVKIPASVFEYRKYDLHGDKAKAKEIHALFRDPAVKAIFCAKGGYGCIRLLPHLDANLIRAHPKIFMGYSDTSFILNFLLSRCNLVCFHGPMVLGELSRDMPQVKQKEMLTALTGRKALGKLTHKNIQVIKKGKASGILMGGCLSSLVRILGTSYEINTEGAILFLEDISESPTNIEEMLFHLKIAGKLDKVHGLVFGQMYNCGSPNVLMHRIAESLADIAVPMLFGFPSGHSFSNITLPLGMRVTLDSKVPGLIFRQIAVS